MVLCNEEDIIIFGTERAGKSTLSKKINKEFGYFAFSVDKFVSTFFRAYPQLEINYTNEQTAANLAPFLGHFLSIYSSSYHGVEGNRFVIEGYFDFEKIIPIWDFYEDLGEFKREFNKHFLLIGLIYPNQTPDGLFSDIRKHDTEEDWTYNLSDDELRGHVIRGIEYSRNFYENFKQYDPIIYDVSENREQVLDKIVNDIKIIFDMI